MENRSREESEFPNPTEELQSAAHWRDSFKQNSTWRRTKGAEASKARKRIFLPGESWLPMRNEIVQDVLPSLKERRAGQLLLVMTAKARRSRTREFAANLHDLSKSTGCDPRTARRCIMELIEKGCVRMVDGGILRSPTNKPRWRTPFSTIDLSSGNWFPVPRFLITRYLRAYPASLLLVVLLYFQHRGWRNDCWPGVPRLAEITGWNPRTVYDGLHILGQPRPWERLGTGLPWPLEITWQKNQSGDERRHFRLRAVNYFTIPGQRLPVVGLTSEFAAHFGYKQPIKFAEETEDDAA